jgi:hypothetical protein
MCALRRDIAAGSGRGLAVTVKVRTLKRRSNIHTLGLKSLNAESHVVAPRFDTSCVSVSIGSRLFLPSRPGLLLNLRGRLSHHHSSA